MSSFKRNFFKIFAGSASGQIIAIVLLPILTRQVNPGIFGLYSISTIMVMILSPIFCLKLDHSLLSSNRKDKKIILRCGIAYSHIFFIITLIFLFLYEQLFNFSNLFWVILTCLSISSFTISQIIISYHMSIGEFNLAIKHRLFRTIFCLISQILLCFIFIPSVELLLIGYILTNIFSFLIFNKLSFFSTFYIPKINILKRVFIKEKNFTYYQTISDLFSTMSQYVMNFSMMYFSTTAVIGTYSMTTRIMQAPITLITSSIKEAFYYKIKKYKDSKIIKKELLKITFILITPAIIGSIIIYPFIPALFSILFGEEWKESGIYAQILLPWFIFLFINQPFTATANIIGIQRKVLFFDIFTLISRIISVLIGWLYFNNVYFTLAIFSFTGVIINILSMLMIFYYTKRVDKK
ncbi:lipopolysaccharide biosynthesis protein [Proteus mirabilis]|uniref:lipopolysaccharide biosynthesis protein n=1 Tax=Proteus mirabilis TaxID=584 RepID=UPI0025770F2A|nr:lipopolysaccharide biosynthesis protein [Proteus mirabilis]MDM3648397.1 lipopolysaccharide biosynthesis protein [Proteus mirabilis]